MIENTWLEKFPPMDLSQNGNINSIGKLGLATKSAMGNGNKSAPDVTENSQTGKYIKNTTTCIHGKQR